MTKRTINNILPNLGFWQTLEQLSQISWLYLFALGLVAGALLIPLATSVSPYLGIAALVGIGVFMMMVKHPELGLYMTALVVPMERFGRFTDDSSQFTISLMRVIGVVGLAALLLHNLSRKKGFTFSTPFWLYFAYTGIGFLTLTYTTDFIGSVRAVAAMLGNLLFLFMVINLARSRTCIILTLLLWLSASLLAAAYSTYDWHFGSEISSAVQTDPDDDRGKGVQSVENRFSTVWQDQAEWQSLGGSNMRRSMGPTSHAAVYGINLIMTLPFFYFLLRLPLGNLTRVAILCATGLIFYNILLTNTRAVILLAGLISVFAVFRKLVIIRQSYIVPGIFLITAIILVIPPDIYNRVLDISNYSVKKSGSLRARMDYVVAGLRAIEDNFLTGQGVGNQKAIPKYLDSNSVAAKETTVHNEYLQTFVETGVIGWGLFFTFVFLMLWYSFRAAANIRHRPDLEQEYWFMVACQLCMISVLIFGVQVDVFHFPLKGWWLITGLTYAMYSWSKRQLTERPLKPG